ncbi:NAD(P)H-dependent oxidoreductase [Rhodoferax ferrireducens]|uniref:NAD(P)H-dependent oxidoreductase n=1 Tax=Rhodoferax ferrireducens TaxID=192843 RepID=UPI00298E7291|nr:NAD(P)H-dependent oxidoreductase [Rhodoferax ferrireducens]WPC65321.1 NAD(P)H-dependent oxidoreductase [Rhodoferax ferrireducens]
MKILTVYAHPEPKSFCHAVLQQFTKGLEDAGHTNEVVDLYAIGFNPVLTTRDFANWLPDENAPDVVEKVVKERVFAPDAGLLQRIVAWSKFHNKSPLGVMAMLRKMGPADVREQQHKVADAQALVLISPIWFVGFPAILKGWIERVFTLGFAFSLTSAGWRGDIEGRIGLLKHEKALIINTTIFNEKSYQERGLREAMRRLIDDFCLHYPGIQTVEHEFFYAVNMADKDTLQGYLERAYRLGKEFSQ